MAAAHPARPSIRFASSCGLLTALLLLLPLSAQAQQLPLAIGAQAEIPASLDNEPSRIVPFLGVFLPGMGHVKAQWSETVLNEAGDRTTHRRLQRVGGEIGLNMGLLVGESYVAGLWRNVKSLDDGVQGDAIWQEWGTGVGSVWRPAEWILLQAEVVHIWVGEHRVPDATEAVRTSGRVWQMSLGFAAFLY